MKPPLENIGISQRSREILITLKRRTGIANWNIICRWAFCDSLANQNRPLPVVGQADSNIDMSWDTFAGEISEALLAAFEVRAAKDGISRDKHDRAAYFRSLLERGIKQLASESPQASEAMVVLRALSEYHRTPVVT
jgi:DNA sulfur modification protein DndE